MFILSERFGWTPKEIGALTEEEKMLYISILKGISSAKPKETGGMAMTPRRMK